MATCLVWSNTGLFFADAQNLKYDYKGKYCSRFTFHQQMLNACGVYGRKNAPMHHIRYHLAYRISPDRFFADIKIPSPLASHSPVLSFFQLNMLNAQWKMLNEKWFPLSPPHRPLPMPAFQHLTRISSGRGYRIDPLFSLGWIPGLLIFDSFGVYNTLTATR